MKGSITIKVQQEEAGLHIATEVDLQDVSKLDKACLLNAFLKGLNIDHIEAEILLLLIRRGVVSAEDVPEETANG